MVLVYTILELLAELHHKPNRSDKYEEKHSSSLDIST